ncbi:aminotransferase class III-fold pyridoxal phosphate-dependent enzyme [Paenibacillus phytorum]|uniref:aminotransferase class III-fold pyridoxal phosphate-dependent enzyme n=1 Tax=Paenibacillus phytorum TaxID=2654977 RepID=UPI001FEBD839|nr:aminotransferase class III-fold pyridoxal phosphate-dependent enzyme [Paenibacillus phytorum]
MKFAIYIQVIVVILLLLVLPLLGTGYWLYHTVFAQLGNIDEDKWWSQMEENPFLLGSSTFGGNPFCSAGAIAGIHTILDENIPQMAKEKGDYILKQLKEIQARYSDILVAMRGMGLLIGMEFADNNLGYTLAKQLF